MTQDGLTFLILKSMLLTGFDAAMEQVLYLDRGMKEHERLQVIARVNCTHAKKDYGLILEKSSPNYAIAIKESLISLPQARI